MPALPRRGAITALAGDADNNSCGGKAASRPALKQPLPPVLCLGSKILLVASNVIPHLVFPWDKERRTDSAPVLRMWRTPWVPRTKGHPPTQRRLGIEAKGHTEELWQADMKVIQLWCWAVLMTGLGTATSATTSRRRRGAGSGARSGAPHTGPRWLCSRGSGKWSFSCATRAKMISGLGCGDRASTWSGWTAAASTRRSWCGAKERVCI
ncbi:uncharacterized protein LOC142598936 isoform X2 [Balearica regulorum gibbericeps]|uniref:uncharacterized protein LOC142598936 isoform X2 n=1 Tax=Balearica regulorum gibbericeps TaxID=100784 RepID=UPI003F63A9CC